MNDRFQTDFFFSEEKLEKKKCKTLSLAFLDEAIATSKTERGAHTDTHTHTGTALWKTHHG